MKKQYKLGVIGGGFMAQAIIGGIDFIKPKKIIVSDPSATAREKLTYLGVNVTENNRDVADNCEYLLLAVKPQTFPAVAESLKGVPVEKVISIMAGVKKQVIRDALFGQTKVVRVMPNLCARVGKSVNAFCPCGLSEEETESIRELLSCFGLAYKFDESYFDIITGLTGSSPAYTFRYARALTECGVQNGMTFEQARDLSLYCIAGCMDVLASARSLDEMSTTIDNVCSKGGTTIEGIYVLDKAGFDKTVIDAVNAAIKRSRELAGNK